MKHGDKKKRLTERRPARSGGSATAVGPTLCEFWAELQRAKAAGEPLPTVPLAGAVSALSASPAPTAPHSAAQNTPTVSHNGSFRSSGSGSGGSGGGGYGLALIAPDPVSQERIRRIMRSLCEKDAERKT